MNSLIGWMKEKPIRGVVICLMTAAASLATGFGVPSLVTTAVQQSATETIAYASEQVDDVIEEVHASSLWFNPDYLRDEQGEFSNQLINAEQLIEGPTGANSQFASANSSVRTSERIEHYQEARELAEQAAATSEKIQNTLEDSLELRDSVQQDLSTLVSDLDSLSGRIANTRQQFENQKGNYLSRDIDPLSQTLSAVDSELAHAKSLQSFALNIMQPPDSSCSCGDPRTASMLIAEARTHTSGIDVQLASIGTSLDVLKEAMQNAARYSGEASISFQEAQSYVDEIQERTAYRLLDSEVSLQLAEQKLGLARITLESLVENKIDYLTAYNAAKESINASNTAIAEADTEVETALYVEQQIARFQTEYDYAIDLAGEAEFSEGLLSRFHASGAWIGIIGNVDQAYGFINSATPHRDRAINLSSMDVQNFASAKSEIDAAMEELSQARGIANTVIEFVLQLESNRNQWPTVETDAQDAINSETQLVNQYRNQSSARDAINDYDEAVRLLGEARSEANFGYYADAVYDAQEALRIVDDTGSRAKQLYDDEQRRIREEEAARQRAAAEAARLVAEAAARAAEESSRNSYSSPSLDFGDSSPSYSSGSSDSGGFSNSSPYDGGGMSNSGSYDGGDW
jgi:hypothetical protein